jgi:hypothetical protein
MSLLGNFTKQPAEVETYSISYNDDLTANDNLLSSIAAVSGSDSALVVDYVAVIEQPTDHRVRVKLSGGTNGVRYKVSVTTTTADGRVLQDEFFVKIKDI